MSRTRRKGYTGRTDDRDTRTGLLEAGAECRDCGWECLERNAVGVGAQHSDRTGHWVVVNQSIVVSYRQRDSRPEDHHA